MLIGTGKSEVGELGTARREGESATEIDVGSINGEMCEVGERRLGEIGRRKGSDGLRIEDRYIELLELSRKRGDNADLTALKGYRENGASWGKAVAAKALEEAGNFSRCAAVDLHTPEPRKWSQQI